MTKRRLTIYIIGVLLAAACTDDLPTERKATAAGALCFTPGVAQQWLPTRSLRPAAREASGAATPTRMDGGRLYLHAECVDGIYSRTVSDQSAPADSAATRGVPRTAANFYRAFGVFSYVYTGTWDGSQTPGYMYNVEVKQRPSGSVYVSDRNYYWPSAPQHLRCYAYAPYGAEGLTLPAPSDPGAPVLRYEVPADARQQPDLLVAVADETTTDARPGSIPMDFRHLLTAVRFKIGERMLAGTIDRITLKNIRYRGAYDCDADAWTVEADVRDFSYDVDFPTDGTKNILVVTGDSTFMLMPQTLGADAAVEVVFTDTDGTTETYTAALSDGTATWAQGQTVTYALMLNPDRTQYILTVDPPASAYAYDGGSQTVAVSSYKKDSEGTLTPLGWTITAMQYSYDDGTTWSTVGSQLAFSSSTGTGSVAPTELTATVRQTGYEYDRPYEEALTNAAEVTERRDLSMYDVNGQATGSRNTANCYVVRAPGKYRFPIVYGNAIKNGATNASSYTSTFDVEAFLADYYNYLCTDPKASTTYTTEESRQDMVSTWRKNINAYTLWHFKNAYNDDISDPWIHKNVHDGSPIVPTTAEIAWQDYDDIIRNENISITHVGDEYYVDFEVKKADIMLGNAVIQVRDAAGIVQWSWHIWMTSHDLTATGPFTNQTGYQYSFLPQPVGYVEKEVGLSFLPRLFRVTVVQEESGEEAVFLLEQTGHTGDTDMYYAAPYYQFGRKDPMPMEDISAFTIDTRTSNLYSPLIYEAIRTPSVFYAHPGSGGSTDKNWHGGTGSQDAASEYPRIDNLWDANCTAYEIGFNGNRGAFTDGPVTKTVYDPSPAGFHVPENNAFTGFADGEASWRSDVNSGDYTYGYSAVLELGGKTLIVPACGERSQDGTIKYFPYWGEFCMSGKANYWGDSMYFMTNPTGSSGAYTVNLHMGQNLTNWGPYMGIGDACCAYILIPAQDR